MKYVLIIFTSCMALSALAEDIMTIESTISGNSEQPRVLTIVPWQEPESPDYMGHEIDNIGETIDIFHTIERQQFNQERHYIHSARAALTTGQ